MPNHVKTLLAAGGAAIGTTVFEGSECRFLAGSGFDFLLFDVQHSADDLKRLAAPIASLRGRRASPIVRVAENRADQICFALDQGARGVVAPMINTPEAAQQMVAWCRYPPAGERSSAGVRGEWGEHSDYRAYMDAVNAELLILPMIETREALDSVSELAQVPGVDVLLVGPSDLSIHLDVPLDYTNRVYQQALERIAAACADAGIAAGLYFAPPGLGPERLLQMGFRFFSVPWQPWARQGIEGGLAALR